MQIKRRAGLPRMDFHVMNRGARKTTIFTCDDDRSLFVNLLGRFALEYEVKIIAWSLMCNHYHIEPNSEGTPLYEMIRVLDSTYARAFNEKYEGSGCLFQGPFKSMAIPDTDGLVYVSRYIHANPVSLGFRPEEYRWSSCRAYLGLVPCPPWLDPSPVLQAIGGMDAYRKYLEDAPVKRQCTKGDEDEVGNFYQEMIRHMEGRCINNLLDLNGIRGRFSAQTFVCWSALRLHGIPAHAVKKYYGYASDAVVHSVAGRFERSLTENSGLRQALRCV